MDTNIVVSAALKPEGLQPTVLLLAITKPLRFYVSAAILAEYRDVSLRLELRIRKGLRQRLLQLIGKFIDKIGGRERIRTPGLLVANEPLSQLSYSQQ